MGLKILCNKCHLSLMVKQAQVVYDANLKLAIESLGWRILELQTQRDHMKLMIWHDATHYSADIFRWPNPKGGGWLFHVYDPDGVDIAKIEVNDPSMDAFKKQLQLLTNKYKLNQDLDKESMALIDNPVDEDRYTDMIEMRQDLSIPRYKI